MTRWAGSCGDVPMGVEKNDKMLMDLIHKESKESSINDRRKSLWHSKILFLGKSSRILKIKLGKYSGCVTYFYISTKFRIFHDFCLFGPTLHRKGCFLWDGKTFCWITHKMNYRNKVKVYVPFIAWIESHYLLYDGHGNEVPVKQW